MDNLSAQMRIRFAEFLEQIADTNSVSTIEWQSLVVTHYTDHFLEEVRRCTVRLMQDRLPYHSNTEASRETLRCWAMTIRSSCSEVSTDAQNVNSPHLGGQQLAKQGRAETLSVVDFTTLIAWYLSQCNCNWQHQYGIKLQTLDNPGWLLSVDLIHTDLQGRSMPDVIEGCQSKGEPVSPRWINCSVKDNQFLGACDPTQVARLFDVFDQFRAS